MIKSSWMIAAIFGAALTGSGPAFAAPRATPTPPPPPSPWTAPAPAADGATTTTTTVSSSIMGPARQENMTYRPSGSSLGIGAGWTFPSDLGTPNTFTARFRREDGLTIEPGVQVSVGLNSTKVSGGGASAKGDSTNIALILGAAIRKPMMSRNQVDVVGIITPNIQITSGSSKHSRSTPCPTMPVAPKMITFIGATSSGPRCSRSARPGAGNWSSPP